MSRQHNGTNILSRVHAFITLYRHPQLLTILSLGFVSGLPLPLIMGTLSVWLAKEGISNTSIGLFSAMGIPYALKFIWSPMMDHLRAPWPFRVLGRRRGWLLFLQCLLVMAIVALGHTQPQYHPWWTALCAFLVSFFSASQDIVVDAYRVEILPQEEQAAGAVAGVFGYRVGMLVSGAGALALAYYTEWESVYNIMAACIGIGMLTVLKAKEPSGFSDADRSNSATTGYASRFVEVVVRPVQLFMQHPSWAAILLFILLYKLGDAFAGVMTNPFFVSLGFTTLQIGLIGKTFGFGAVVLGGVIGSVVVYRMGMLAALWVCGILQLLSNGMFILQVMAGHNVAMLAAVVAIENMASGMGTAAFVAYMSGLCNRQYTATQYACLSALASVGRTVLGMFSGVVADQLGWMWFFSISMVMALPGLIVLRYLMRQPTDNKRI